MKVWKVAVAAVLVIVLFALVAIGQSLPSSSAPPKERTHFGSTILGAPHVYLADAPAPVLDAPVPDVVVTCIILNKAGEVLEDATCTFHFQGSSTAIAVDSLGQAVQVFKYGSYGSLQAEAPGHYAQILTLLAEQDKEVEFRLESHQSAVKRVEPGEQGQVAEEDPQDAAPAGAAQPAPAFPPPQSPPPPPVCSGIPVWTCPTHGPQASMGDRDRFIPDLSWAALKTGWRFAVAWSSPENYSGQMTYSIDSGPNVTVSEGFNRGVHLIVIELPATNIGRIITFTVSGGSVTSDVHKAWLANAMTSWNPDEPYGTNTGIYTVNLLVLANESPHRGNLEGGFDYFADLLFDSTDGYVRMGHSIVMYNNQDQKDGGRQKGCTGVGCVNWYDVVFTSDENPGAAGTANLDGIQSPSGKIVMNQNSEAPGPDSPSTSAGMIHEVGHVLTHEFGHYAFGAMDFYPGGAIPVAGVFANAAIPVSDCWVPASGVSIMAGSRQPTEFDDEVNRCPPDNEDWHTNLAGYYPTWTRMRDPTRFGNLPDRLTLPDPGPPFDSYVSFVAPYDVGDEAPPI